ncbi:cell division protein FtsH [Candidatus Woesebacteria bacterium GWC2_33_12]|uniref:ATP-dependent zinc metalloprotease FtsH n=1 Tax=Candidatus Woesebacteria bacterium GW2011_GWB1_33_22 TaxID=1618566 RepID=A0A0G0A1U3_9BACT|nr:MAG: ATP-dependent zinc metalloprotease FtsH [Candidatus Woesebacteria bacterium GW2011_GWC2_33_12]KKP42355.1 MAG: ATP-dependent zinc metalloprotease FtsH [Candidatus Woesebacteria bacterium GW2011_GWA2_33_20]KKP45106.1 MAG: ATP-dependent zinc metalloprotease FtsH [Candidatus Woesebacteria bacterium GW2011_GWB1_33_22]KKP46982.1 MAG: ATP-dependent zinc metalloprotease FtsH [Microgenomates group bacterium GW2011_GWC1_33_28]KKP50808.1 MAG: ATP-dependent zinc metalloprotease FtsH [Candidatus Woe
MKPKEEKKDPKKSTKKQVTVKMKINIWTVIFSILLVLFFLPSIFSLLGIGSTDLKVDLSSALNDLKNEKIEKVSIEKNNLILTYKDKTTKLASKEEGQSFTDLLVASDIDPNKLQFTVVDQTLAKAMAEVVSIVLPIILLGGLFFYMMKSQTRGAQDIFSFGKSKAKIFAKGKQDTTFADVAGVDEAKKELVEVVDFLKNPEKYKKIGARTPKGVLLFGPSGVGKTMLAKAVAGEANVPFFSMAGSEFMEMLVGIGASRVRDLFAQAKAQAPSIIFIDEIDAIGRQRGRSGLVGGHDEREQTLNQILVEMDGFTPNESVIVLAATNRGDLLDPALLRPGRFDRRVTLDMPDKEGRQAILAIHSKGKTFGKDINWARIADRTVGFSGADLENMLNEAAIGAARLNKPEIDMTDIEESATKVKLGPAKKRLQSAEDKKITAYHEAGHAIVTHFTKGMDPVHRISIVARGMSLGHTLIPPAADRTHDTKTRLLDQITAMLGGRAAEEFVFNEMTSGASNDIANATRIARAMVIEWGMSSLGPVNYGPDTSSGEFGQTDWYQENAVSPAMQEKIDNEVRKIMEHGLLEAEKLIKKYKSKLDLVAKELLEKETVDKDQFERIVGKKQNGEGVGILKEVTPQKS